MSQRRMGGLTAVAQDLTSVKGKLVTRQGVYMWWKRRERNSFPERHPVTTQAGNTRLLFDLDEVAAWYDTYMSTPWQGRRK